MEVEIKKFYPFYTHFHGGRILGYADILIGSTIEIRGVKLLKNKYGGLYVQMPRYEGREIVEIHSKELAEAIRRKVVDFYKNSIV